MIDPNIEHALAPDKIDWKEPLWAKFKSYAIGFGAAVLVVALLLSVLYLWKGSEAALAPQTEIMTIEPIAPTKQFVEPNKKVVKPAKAVKNPTISKIDTVQKPKPAEPLTQFDRDLAEFERKIP
jgi:hypothetical protein